MSITRPMASNQAHHIPQQIQVCQARLDSRATNLVDAVESETAYIVLSSTMIIRQSTTTTTTTTITDAAAATNMDMNTNLDSIHIYM